MLSFFTAMNDSGGSRETEACLMIDLEEQPTRTMPMLGGISYLHRVNKWREKNKTCGIYLKDKIQRPSTLLPGLRHEANALLCIL